MDGGALMANSSLAGLIRATPPSSGGSRCSVGALLESLDATERAGVAECLADKTIASSVIARVLSENGHPMKDHPIQRHRRGDCTCGDR